VLAPSEGGGCEIEPARKKKKKKKNSQKKNIFEQKQMADVRSLIDAAFREQSTPRDPTVLVRTLRDALTTGPLPPAVPLGAHTAHADGALVRLRCMVQDMHDPEFFPGSYSAQDGSLRAAFGLGWFFFVLFSFLPSRIIL
jgi:hypothetical protein